MTGATESDLKEGLTRFEGTFKGDLKELKHNTFRVATLFVAGVVGTGTIFAGVVAAVAAFM